VKQQLWLDEKSEVPVTHPPIALDIHWKHHKFRILIVYFLINNKPGPLQLQLLSGSLMSLWRPCGVIAIHSKCSIANLPVLVFFHGRYAKIG